MQEIIMHAIGTACKEVRTSLWGKHKPGLVTNSVYKRIITFNGFPYVPFQVLHTVSVLGRLTIRSETAVDRTRAPEDHVPQEAPT
jgi:hypothetical protein